MTGGVVDGSVETFCRSTAAPTEDVRVAVRIDVTERHLLYSEIQHLEQRRFDAPAWRWSKQLFLMVILLSWCSYAFRCRARKKRHDGWRGVETN
jgi:hypothetical protein